MNTIESLKIIKTDIEYLIISKGNNIQLKDLDDIDFLFNELKKKLGESKK